MSGGVGPTCNDISLPKEEEEESEHKQTYDPTSLKNNSTKELTPRKAGFLSFRQLKMLAVIIVFSASGMVSPEDFLFVLFSLVYMYFLSKVAFPTNINHAKEGNVFSPSQYKILRIYVLVGAIIGLFLPIAYIFEGILEGDKQGIKAASPHVFLLASQVFMEGVSFSGGFSLPIRAFVPVCYNGRRIFTIVDWLRSEFGKVEEDYGGSSPTRLYIGRGLAIANMAFWCFNLFGFLLPVYLPKVFKRYYSGIKEKD